MIRPRRSFLISCLFLVILLTSACGDAAESRPAAASEVRDSAGVRIVTSAGPAWREDEGWRVSAEPSVSIGVLEGDPAYQLYQAWDAARLSDGSIVVANSGTKELRFYDPSGRHIRSVGGEGGGPGEFDGFMFVGVAAGDTIIVWDSSAKRVSRFTADGTFIDATTADAAGMFAQALGLFEDGSVALNDGFGPPMNRGEMSSGPVRDSVTYMRVASSGETIDMLGVFPGDERYVQIVGGSLFIGGRPFGDRTAFAVHGDRYYVGNGDVFEILGFDVREDSLRTIIRIAKEVVPVTEEDAARWRERRLEGQTEEQRAELKERFEAMLPAEHFPTYSDLIVDSEGALWARPGAPDVDTMSVAFDVFDSQGIYLGVVDLPSDLDPIEIGPDWILGSSRDDFNVEYIVIHALRRGLASTP